jgi:SAM-dependent methyltransferase
MEAGLMNEKGNTDYHRSTVWLRLRQTRFMRSSLVRRVQGKLFRGYYSGLFGKSATLRWAKVAPFADLRPGDTVLDIGCAEGEISMEVARSVGFVHGIDISDYRARKACATAKRRGITNVRFQAGDLGSVPLPASDVTLLLHVLGQTRADGSCAGLVELAQAAGNTRRQIIVWSSFNERHARMGFTLNAAQQALSLAGFSVFTPPPNEDGHIIVGTRTEIPS